MNLSLRSDELFILKELLKDKMQSLRELHKENIENGLQPIGLNWDMYPKTLEKLEVAYTKSKLPKNLR